MHAGAARGLLLLAAVLSACQSAPRPLVAGTDACDFCRMAISDVRFGAELQSRTGKIHTFDAIECVASFYVAAEERNDVRAVWVADYESGKLIPADSAVFLRGGRIQSPMGRSLVAFSAERPLSELQARYGGEAMRWPAVVALMRAEQIVPGADTLHRHGSSERLTPARGDVVVDPQGAVPTITAALAAARPGAHVVVRPGVYREPTLRITVPLTLEGSGATLDGEGVRELIVVAADDVTVRGFVLRNTGANQVEERAALRVEGVRNCLVERNRVEHSQFGIYLARVADCTVRNNEVRGDAGPQALAGNSIHVWQSERVHLLDNRVSGHRDGIYFEFVKAGEVRGNMSERSARYGLHFMFSDDCWYEGNTFRANGAGVAVMYTRRVRMIGNRFERNWGGSAYGLLLKDINDSEIRGNDFIANSLGLYLEGSDRNRIEGNRFEENGWALRILANAQENVVTRNAFAANAFDVGTNSMQNFSTFRENYWDNYRGYDLDRDGYGDVPHAPVRLFALIVEQSPPALILLRSIVVDMLDLAERVVPLLTPRTLIDERPLMRTPLAAARRS